MLMVRCVVWLLTVVSVVVNGGDLVEPITAVKRGFRDRVEYISAEINKNHLDKGSAPSPEADAYVRRKTAFSGDSTGQLIPGNLGGTGNETYNFIPMNCLISGLWRYLVEQPVYKSVSQGNVVKLSISMTYDNATSTRPSKLVFNTDNKDSKILVQNSTLDNPVPIFPCHHAVIPQSQIVRNETKITTVTTITVTNTTVFVPNPLCENGTGVINSTYCKGEDLFQHLFPKPTHTPLTQDLGAGITNHDKKSFQTTPSSTDRKYLTTSTSKKPPRKTRRPYKEPVKTKATNKPMPVTSFSTTTPWSTSVGYSTTTSTEKPLRKFGRPVYKYNRKRVRTNVKYKPRPVPSSTSSESGYSTTTEGGYSMTSGESDSSTPTASMNVEKRCFSRDWMSAMSVSVCVKDS